MKVEAKQKAIELVGKFSNHVQKWDCYNDAPRDGKHIINDAIDCALIAVDMALNDLNFTNIGYGKGVISGYQTYKVKYWNIVKTELKKMKKP